jgi:hypothetical protein
MVAKARILEAPRGLLSNTRFTGVAKGSVYLCISIKPIDFLLQYLTITDDRVLSSLDTSASICAWTRTRL